MTDPPDHLVLSDLRQIKALADPLRQRILSALCHAPRTTMQVAELLGEPPTKLYRHVDQLEELGLIKLVRTAPKRGTTEKYFQAVARKFSLAGDSLSGVSGGAGDEFFAGVFNETLAAIRTCRANKTDGKAKAEMMLGILRLSPAKFQEFRRRQEALVTEFKVEGEGGELYKFLSVLTPVIADEHDS